MTQSVYLVVLLLCFGLIYPLVTGIFMDKLASQKLCADDDCVYTISLARAEEDYNAPDCRFINIKKGQLIYVYSKLVKEKDSGEFWAGSVYGEQYEDHMGTVGYFPSSLVSEQHVYQEANKTVPTTNLAIVLHTSVTYTTALLYRWTLLYRTSGFLKARLFSPNTVTVDSYMRWSDVNVRSDVNVHFEHHHVIIPCSRTKTYIAMTLISSVNSADSGWVICRLLPGKADRKKPGHSP